MTSLVQGDHVYLVPVLAGRPDDGRGRAPTWDPGKVFEVTPDEAAVARVDVVLLQRPEELQLCTRWLGGRRPGIDIPAAYLEHNPPPGPVDGSRHLVAKRPELLLVHVTYFNDLAWDPGVARTRVIEHGIIDPGYRYTGELERCAVVINEPVRRRRAAGLDLLDAFRRAAPIDLFGIGTRSLGGIESVPQRELHAEMSKRRLYLHTTRWTSLGLTLIEAMHLGMPVVALATTEAPEAIPAPCGLVSTSVERLCREITHLMANPDEARRRGLEAREVALARYSLDRFLCDWDALFAELA